jgi:hypothetical protein
MQQRSSDNAAGGAGLSQGAGGSLEQIDGSLKKAGFLWKLRMYGKFMEIY